MRIVTYRHNGIETFGVAAGSGVVDAGRRLGDRFRGLREVLAAGALDDGRRATAGQTLDASLDDIEVDIPGVGVLCNPIVEE